MKLDDKLMQNAIVRINELQIEVKKQAQNIQGAEQYVEKQLKLYKEDKALRRKFDALQKDAEKIANDFFKHHSQAINSIKLSESHTK